METMQFNRNYFSEPEIKEFVKTVKEIEACHLARLGGPDRTCLNQHVSGFAGTGRKLCSCGKGYVRC